MRCARVTWLPSLGFVKRPTNDRAYHALFAGAFVSHSRGSEKVTLRQVGLEEDHRKENAQSQRKKVIAFAYVKFSTFSTATGLPL